MRRLTSTNPGPRAVRPISPRQGRVPGADWRVRTAEPCLKSVNGGGGGAARSGGGAAEVSAGGPAGHRRPRPSLPDPQPFPTPGRSFRTATRLFPGPTPRPGIANGAEGSAEERMRKAVLTAQPMAGAAGGAPGGRVGS